MCSSQLTFDLETRLLRDAVCNRAQIRSRNDKVKRVIVVLVKGQDDIGVGDRSGRESLAAASISLKPRIEKLDKLTCRRRDLDYP